MSPEISSHWKVDEARHQRLFPADMRPQAHEIIRTWAFYTIAKAMAHEQTVPWHNVVVSGWVVQRGDTNKNEKISKSKGGQKGKKPIPSPSELMDKHTADGVRYWAAHARLGVDTAFDEQMLATGKRLVTKLFNASKFALAQSAAPGPIVRELDRGFVHKMAGVVAEATAAFEAFEFSVALKATETFFWSGFTDSYLELAKVRARTEGDAEGQSSAVAALRLGLSTLLRMFAPVLPYITEEVWSWAFAADLGQPSIHKAPWPTAAEWADTPPPADPGSFELAVAALGAINRAKTGANVGVARGVKQLELAGRQADLDRLQSVWPDVVAAAKIGPHTLTPKADAAEGEFEVVSIDFEEKPPKPPKPPKP